MDWIVIFRKSSKRVEHIRAPCPTATAAQFTSGLRRIIHDCRRRYTASPRLAIPRERESDRWIVSPRPFGEYEIKRAPQTRSGVLSAIRDIVELEAYQRAVRPPDLPQSRYQTVAIFADANGKVYWWRVDDNGAIYDHGRGSDGKRNTAAT